MNKWFKDIFPDKDPYHNRGRDQMRGKKGGGVLGYYAVVNSTSCIKKEERRNKLRSILNLLLYDSMLSRISSCTHSRTAMESRGSISVMYRIATE